MVLLLDENLPKKLRIEFGGHETFTVREMGWSGVSNGALLRLMTEKNFDASKTTDTKITQAH